MSGRVIRQGLLLLALAVLPAVGQALYLRDSVSWRQPSAADEVSVAQATQWGTAAMWIDARPEEEFAVDHVPGALPLTGESWDKQLPQVLNSWSPERKVIVYCSKQTCGASREVARRLDQEAGLHNVFVLQGGWEAWQQSRR